MSNPTRTAVWGFLNINKSNTSVIQKKMDRTDLHPTPPKKVGRHYTRIANAVKVKLIIAKFQPGKKLKNMHFNFFWVIHVDHWPTYTHNFFLLLAFLYLQSPLGCASERTLSRYSALYKCTYYYIISSKIHMMAWERRWNITDLCDLLVMMFYQHLLGFLEVLMFVHAGWLVIGVVDVVNIHVLLVRRRLCRCRLHVVGCIHITNVVDVVFGEDARHDVHWLVSMVVLDRNMLLLEVVQSFSCKHNTRKQWRFIPFTTTNFTFYFTCVDLI